MAGLWSCAPGRARTCDLHLRRVASSPTGPRERKGEWWGEESVGRQLGVEPSPPEPHSGVLSRYTKVAMGRSRARTRTWKGFTPTGLTVRTATCYGLHEIVVACRRQDSNLHPRFRRPGSSPLDDDGGAHISHRWQESNPRVPDLETGPPPLAHRPMTSRNPSGMTVVRSSAEPMMVPSIAGERRGET